MIDYFPVKFPFSSCDQPRFDADLKTKQSNSQRAVAQQWGNLLALTDVCWRRVCDLEVDKEDRISHASASSTAEIKGENAYNEIRRTKDIQDWKVRG